MKHFILKSEEEYMWENVSVVRHKTADGRWLDWMIDWSPKLPSSLFQSEEHARNIQEAIIKLKELCEKY